MLNFISFKVIPYLTGENNKPNVYIQNMNYLNWKYLGKSMQKSLKYLNGKCVDIGSGNSPYKQSILDKVDSYIAIDKAKVHKNMFQTSKEKFIDADIKDLPFDDASIDTIILTQVLEHIDEPYKAISEVSRILKKDGVLILSVPFIYQAHAVRYDYFRFSEYALRKLLKDYDYEILEFHYQGYLGTTIFSIINGFIWNLSSKNKILRNTIFFPFLLIIFTINNLFGIILDKIKMKHFTPNFWVIAKKL